MIEIKYTIQYNTMPNIPQQQQQQQRDPFADMQPIQHQNAFVLDMSVYDADVFNRANAYIAAHQNEAAADDTVPGIANVVQIVPNQYDALAMATAGRYVQLYADSIIGGRRARRSRGQRSRSHRSRGQRRLSRRHRQSKRQRTSRK
jgi:hypothetical protein